MPTDPIIRKLLMDIQLRLTIIALCMVVLVVLLLIVFLAPYLGPIR